MLPSRKTNEVDSDLLGEEPERATGSRSPTWERREEEGQEATCLLLQEEEEERRWIR